MEDLINSLSTYGYAILFFYSLGGGFLALSAAAVLSYVGKMDLEISILVAFVANFIGDEALFYLGRYNKDMIMPYLKNHKRKLALSNILMKKHGYKIIFIQKYIYGLKTLVPIAIALTKYDFKKFTLFNLIASFVWTVSIGLASFYAGGFLVKAASYVSDRPWIAPLFLIVLIYILWIYLSKASEKGKKDA